MIGRPRGGSGGNETHPVISGREERKERRGEEMSLTLSKPRAYMPRASIHP